MTTNSRFRRPRCGVAEIEETGWGPTTSIGHQDVENATEVRQVSVEPTTLDGIENAPLRLDAVA